MRKNAVIPYALIAGIGILLVIVVSFVGLNQQKAIQEDDEQQEQAGDQEDQNGDDSSGKKTSVDGEKVFQNNCASCHGQDLSGKVGPALDTIGSDHSKEDIKNIIAEGPGNMPPGVVKGDKREAVAKWLSKQK
ncbi:hypothetical protein GCM10028778_09410 [Barrientosiimonas marina]|uniref:Cytochrome c550 n=1 Tax=Lentibacillus kimchii TaxID=1542911 RepID=A0ABW2UYB9_9BACI